MKQYCLGFLFSEYDHVVLIEKVKPEWQRGLLNGVGGKLEEGESGLVGMIREFEEETGLRFDEWEERIILRGPDWIIFTYAGWWKGDPPKIDVVKTGEEQASWCGLEQLNDLPVITNLRYIVPLLVHAKNSQLRGIVQLYFDK